MRGFSLGFEEEFEFEPAAAVEDGMASATVFGEGGVFAVDVAVAGAEREVFAEDAVGLGMGVVALLELLTLLDDVAIRYRRPIFDSVEGLVVAN